MHRYVISEAVKQRVLRRQGKLISHDEIYAARAALVVMDMQNHFVAEGFPAEVPLTATGALERWANHHKYMLTPERAAKRLASLDEGAEGFKLYPALEPLPHDLQVTKIKYSAFISGSCDIDAQLKSRGIDTVLGRRDRHQRVLRILRARRHDAGLPGDHAIGRQRDLDRRRARCGAQQLLAVFRRRHDDGRGHRQVGFGEGP
jgi:hypothetical protein